MKFFSPCPPGAEGILAEELRHLGVHSFLPASRGVGFEGDLAMAYEACLNLRTASRLLLELFSGPAKNENELYKLAFDFPWEEHFAVSASIACRVTGVPQSHDPRFATLRLKDAIVDRFTQKYGQRPGVDRRNPDLRMEARWDGRHASVFLNWSGPPLHERSYRLERTDAVLRETSAAVLLSMVGWRSMAANHGAFVDPVCGSGTLLAEAAMMAGDCPPGIYRKRWGFFPWDTHDENLWINTLNRASVRFGRGLERMPKLMGFDISANALKIAKNNLRRAGLAQLIRLEQHDINRGLPKIWPTSSRGLVFADPPYGHRMDDASPSVYTGIGRMFRELNDGWRLALLAPDKKTASATCLRADDYFSTRSGAMDLVLATYSRLPGLTKRLSSELELPNFPLEQTSPEKPAGQKRKDAEKDSDILELDPKSTSLKKALSSKLKALGEWAKSTGVSSYRIWDSDLPEFNATVDWYEGRWLYIKEFDPPSGIPLEKVRRRFDTLVSVLQDLTGCDDCGLYLKTRHRGMHSYGRNGHRTEKFIMRENGARYYINLVDYMDTGVFFEHRSTRAKIREGIGNGRFLNLFCYTGTESVMAAMGGASSTVNVDISSSYLAWTKENIVLNRLENGNHSYHRSDALVWLKTHEEKFDLIFIDPPTHSKGKGCKDWFVQDHHAFLIDEATSHLNPDGYIIFTVNFKAFVLDSGLKKHYKVKDISAETFHRDFAFRPHAHQCWEISLP